MSWGGRLWIFTMLFAQLSTKKICFFLVLTWYILSIYTHISAASRSRARLTSTRRLFLRVSSSFSPSSYNDVLLSCFPLLLLGTLLLTQKRFGKGAQKTKKRKKKSSHAASCCCFFANSSNAFISAIFFFINLYSCDVDRSRVRTRSKSSERERERKIETQRKKVKVAKRESANKARNAHQK